MPRAVWRDRHLFCGTSQIIIDQSPKLRLAFRIRGFIHWLHSFKIHTFFANWINRSSYQSSVVFCWFLAVSWFPFKFHSPDTAVGLICLFLNTYFCRRSLLLCLTVLMFVILVANQCCIIIAASCEVNIFVDQGCCCLYRMLLCLRGL